jgi:hypothetical protein
LLNLKQGKKKTIKERISLLNYNGTLTDNQQTIANIFNNYLSTVTEEIMGTKQNDRITQLNK